VSRPTWAIRGVTPTDCPEGQCARDREKRPRGPPGSLTPELSGAPYFQTIRAINSPSRCSLIRTPTPLAAMHRKKWQELSVPECEDIRFAICLPAHAIHHH